jgi:hypothetical protein
MTSSSTRQGLRATPTKLITSGPVPSRSCGSPPRAIARFAASRRSSVANLALRCRTQEFGDALGLSLNVLAAAIRPPRAPGDRRCRRCYVRDAHRVIIHRHARGREMVPSSRYGSFEYFYECLCSGFRERGTSKRVSSATAVDIERAERRSVPLRRIGRTPVLPADARGGRVPEDTHHLGFELSLQNS